MTRPLNLEILEITPLSLTVSLSLAAQPRWSISPGSISYPATTTSSATQNDILTQGQQQFGVPAAKQRKSRAKGSHRLGHSGASVQIHSGTGQHPHGESEDELTAAEDNADGSSLYQSGQSSTFASHRHNHQQSNSGNASVPPPYTSSSLPGSYPRRLPLPSNSDTVPPSFKELLSKGIVVTVNGNPWNRIVAHVSDDDVPIPTSAASTTGTTKGTGSGETPSGGGHGNSSDTSGISANKSALDSTTTPASFPTPSIIGRQNNLQSREKDRAIVVVYGLEPGKEYEVDLKVLGQLSETEASVSTSLTTPVHHGLSGSGTSSGTRSRANSLRSRPHGSRSRSSSLIQSVVAAQATPSSNSGSNTNNNTVNAVHTGNHAANVDGGSGETFVDDGENGAKPTLTGSGSVVDGTWTGPSTATNPHDSRIHDLRHLISTAAMEKDELAAQLKKTRRESQKAEAALKAEVEALKRAIEKTTLPDLRSRQKSLALQEQVKQAIHGAADAEHEFEEINGRLDGWREEEDKLKEEWQSMQSARNAALEQKDSAIDSERKARGELDTQLSAVKARVHKQSTKKDKLHKENDELRQKLENVAEARREVEKRNEVVRHQQMLVDDYSASGYGGRPVAGTANVGGEYWDPSADSGASGWNSRGMNVSGMRGSESYSIPPQEDLYFAPPGAFPRSRQGSVAPSTFQPRGFVPPPLSSSSRPNSMASANSAAAALATQGIPRSATSGISHLGNPTGFFAPGSTPLPPNQQVPARSIRASLSANVSPMMANVTAAPFMPASTQFTHSAAVPSPPASQHEHTTSLVPPQLQHRIYLPGNRGNRTLASSNNTINPHVGTSTSISPAIPRAEVTPSETASGLSAPSFPPLPSQANTGLIGPGQKAPPAFSPSLATIVTRAIIPSNSTLMHGNQLQKSPGVGHDDNSSAAGGRNPIGTTSRPLSWMNRAEQLDRAISRTTSPAPDDFPVLSPAGSWATAVDPTRKANDSAAAPTFQQPWGSHRTASNPSRNSSRRGSLTAVHEKESEL
ncbi:hypothetical protein QFC22_001788 [Naganishia vaughanmartiniae]|uniref:Uncharacterized protein n=1 Tax=Naganishia vaughanmartiniae TaxID=1424756 RepID=A0ACC2XH57_9TREE|nr:hypothetical protein QFC22_001788 [Naganishia vaughanmartiniae]